MPFDAGYFGLQPAAVATTQVNFCRACDARVVDGDGFNALLHDSDDLCQFAFHKRAHGVQLVDEPRLLDNFKAACHGSANAFASSEGCDAKFE